MPSVYGAEIYEDGTPVILARITGTANTAITQGTVSSIAYTITDTSTNTVVDSGSLTVANVVYDTLQTDAVWTNDSTGYNFKWLPSASSFPTGGVTYAVELQITASGGEKIQVPFSLTPVSIWRS